MIEQSHTAGLWPNVLETLRGAGSKVADWFAPKSEASALKSHYEIVVELPGVKAEDVDLSLHENTLTVRGEKHYAEEQTGRSYFFSEREYGLFQRSFRIPPDADGETVDAEFKDGVLTVRIAKRAEQHHAGRRIDVRQA